MTPGRGQALRRGSGQALRRGSGQALRLARRAAGDIRWLTAGLLVAVLAFFAVTNQDVARLSFVTPGVEPTEFTVIPEGDAVHPLSPIQVTFPRAPLERDGANILTLEPAVPGQYVWQSERTLLFQPEWPGMRRGQRYTIRVAAQPDAGLSRPFSREITTDGALRIETVIPAPDDVDVPGNVQLLVQFNRSVAPLTVLAAQLEAPVVEFDPPLAGRGEWLNTSLYRFVPAPGALQPNTRYEARIRSGLSGQPDGVLDEDYVWRFTTFGPAIERVTPDVNTRFVGPNQQVVVKFNQPMNRASVQGGFRLTDPNGLPASGSFAWSEDDTLLTFTPAQAFAPLFRYELRIAGGVAGRGGGALKTEWRSAFEAVGRPTVARTRPADGAQDAQRFGIDIEFSNPMNGDSLEGKVSVSGIDPDDVNEYFSPDELHLFLSTPLQPSTAYTVSVAAGAVDRYGQALPPYRFSFTTGARPAAVTLAIPNEIATYSASAEPILYFHATNMEQATFTLYPLTVDEMRDIQQRNYISDGPEELFQPSQPALYAWTEDVAGGRDEVLLKATSLSRNGGPLPKGDYLVRTSGQFRSELAFSVVDTALITKQAYDELLVWAIDLDTGQPLPNVTLRASGGALAGDDEARTNSQGLASFAVPDRLERLMKGDQTLVIALEGDGRWGVTSTAWSQGVNTYDLGLPYEFYPRKYVGNVYTDRPIYRAGEEVFYKLVIRTDDDAVYSVPKDLKDVTLTITDSQGNEVSSQAVETNEFGTFAGSLKLAADAPTGDYGIQVAWQAEPNLQPGPRGAPGFQLPVAGTSFLVAEFRVPEFEVTASTAAQDYVNGDAIAARVAATFFFGGAVAGTPVEWSVLASPFAPRFEGFERYSFVDFDYFQRGTAVFESPVRQTGAAVTDSTGVAEFSVPATIAGDEGPQRYQISATVTDQSAQAVAASTTVSVHPASLYAGVRTSEYVAAAGEQAQIEVVSVDLQGRPLPNRNVSVGVYQRTWITTKEQTAEGARRYRSEPRDTLITTLSVTTDGEGRGSVAFTPERSGTLRIVAEARDDRGRTARSATYLWVWGGGFGSWEVANDDTLKLVADKEEYEVGDTAEVLVPAPFEGATGLVTVERGKVMDRRVQQFPTNSERLRIPIIDRSVPDVFVSVVLYRPPTAEDPVPRYKVGYVQLKVSTETRVLNVSITPDRDRAQPGDKVRYAIEVTDSGGRGVKAELSVAVVDKAVLSLAEERGESGLRAFWYERGLGVATASSLAVSINRSNDVISEPPAGGKGGGGLEDERLRQEFRNTALWEAQLETDDRGRASVELELPDNLTTWRLQARAVSGNILVGEGTNELLSTKPLLLRPALPRFLRVGDKPTLRALVRNATDQPANVTVSLVAEGIDVSGPLEQRVSVAPNASTMVEWPASVSREGSVKLTLRAEGGAGLKDAVVRELPVLLDVTQEATATGGVVKDKPLTEAVYLPTFAITDRGALTVSVRASITGSMVEDLADFEPETWEGHERVASRIISTLAVRRADPEAARRGAFSEGQLRSDVAGLISAQLSDGGWAWCRLCFTSDPWITGWVLIALGEWRREGNEIDESTLSRAAGYVTSYVNRFTDVARPADPNEKAFLLYSLAVAGAPGQNESILRALYEQERANLASWGRAYLLLGFAEAGLTRRDEPVRRLLDDLAANVIPSANGNHWEDAKKRGPTQSGPRTTALVLDALVRLDPKHPLIEETVRWLSVALGTNVCRTSLERAEAIRALSGFAEETGELGAGFAFAVRLDGREVLGGSLSSRGEASGEETILPLSDLTPGKTSLLTLARGSRQRGRMYYTLDLRYVTPAKEVEALNRGLAVSHEYTRLEAPDQPIDRVRVGETVRIKVTVVAPAERNYVVVTDGLPAGLEGIDPKLKITDPALVAQLETERRQANRPPELDYYAPWFRWYYSPWQQVDLRDDRVILSAQTLAKGVYEFIYYARATTPGEFFVAPAVAEESYFPEVFGRSDSGRFYVDP